MPLPPQDAGRVLKASANRVPEIASLVKIPFAKNSSKSRPNGPSSSQRMRQAIEPYQLPLAPAECRWSINGKLDVWNPKHLIPCRCQFPYPQSFGDVRRLQSGVQKPGRLRNENFVILEYGAVTGIREKQ